MTNELRAVLTEALVEASYDYWYEKQTLGVDSRGKDVCAYLVDRLLSLPSVAVIQLPDEMTDRTNVAEKIRCQPMWEHQGSWATVEGDEVEFEADNQIACGVIPVNSVPGLVSVLAAAAAAVLAEGEDK
ncbi:hypothetical protein SEA_RENAUD18_72 [Mycobacterium phage Renaud18]|uniref:Uncharacterized protein n=1 Tax=Mycobacterium phage Renaud18 TaxID=2301701 RepID=A0A385E2M7_9CAUD|nr:hypothetical protein HWB85_gp072 [Mycobacterium phage Renaud18]AXQ64979.1 hypothetical protein SEA_RENAUD18_72 [Mycobacterium phage Renaud18]